MDMDLDMGLDMDVDIDIDIRIHVFYGQCVRKQSVHADEVSEKREKKKKRGKNQQRMETNRNETLSWICNFITSEQ